MKKTAFLSILLAALALQIAAPTLAEHHEEKAAANPIIWVSFVKAPPGASQGLVQNIIKEAAPVWDKLLADGEILEWGVAQPVTHNGNDPYTAAEWATFKDWSAVDSFMAAFMAKQGSMTEEERAASTEAYMKVVVPGSHFDAVHESYHAATNGESPTYLRIGYHKANPGMDGKVTKMWKTFAQPVYEKLLADGAIQGFGLFGQALHGDDRWTHGSWTTMSGLAANNAVDAAFKAAEAARSEEENMKVMKGFQEALTPGAHWDELLMVVHYNNGSGE